MKCQICGKGPHEAERQVVLFRAISNSGDNPLTLAIEAYHEMPEIRSLEEALQLHHKMGTELADALLASLPGGTIDALLAELMRRRASLFSVPL